MDNITHSLISCAIGVAVARKSPAITKPLILLAILAGNFPDLDFLYTPLISEPFGYLLHHRGHTHTLLGAIPCALIAFGFILILYRFLKQPFSRNEKLVLLLSSIISSLAHILLDGLNTYGVHPFWPFSNKWFFGDILFIIEPSLWISMSLALLPLAKNKIIKSLLCLIIIVASALIIFPANIPEIIMAAWIFLFIVVLLIISKVEAIKKFWAWISASLGIILIFLFNSLIAQRHLENINTYKAHVLNSLISPAPANPFCWSYLQIYQENDNVMYSRGNFQLFSKILDLNCDKYSIYSNQEEYLKVAAQKFSDYKDNCRWQAFLKFSRAPSIVECNNQDCTSDQRFSRSSKNFSVKPLDGQCPDFLPPWEPPVQSLANSP